MDWKVWVIVILASAVANLFLDRQKRTGKGSSAKIDYTQAYQAKYLLTKNEWSEYKKLRQYAEEKNLIVCPKVRLLDIVEPRKGQKQHLTLINKVQAKHVDFVICDKDLRIKAILELDDNSHNKADRQSRDEFVDTVLESVGYKVLHTKGITENTLDFIEPVGDKS